METSTEQVNLPGVGSVTVEFVIVREYNGNVKKAGVVSAWDAHGTRLGPEQMRMLHEHTKE